MYGADVLLILAARDELLEADKAAETDNTDIPDNEDICHACRIGAFHDCTCKE